MLFSTLYILLFSRIYGCNSKLCNLLCHIICFTRMTFLFLSHLNLDTDMYSLIRSPCIILVPCVGISFSADIAAIRLLGYKSFVLVSADPAYHTYICSL